MRLTGLSGRTASSSFQTGIGLLAVGVFQALATAAREAARAMVLARSELLAIAVLRHLALGAHQAALTRVLAALALGAVRRGRRDAAQVFRELDGVSRGGNFVEGVGCFGVNSRNTVVRIDNFAGVARR